MNVVRTRCQNPTCHRTTTQAYYQHVHGALTYQWHEEAWGPAPDSAPANQDCPIDHVPNLPVIYVQCGYCGYVKIYGPDW